MRPRGRQRMTAMRRCALVVVGSAGGRLLRRQRQGDRPAAADAISCSSIPLPIPQNYGIHDQFIRDGLAFVCAWNTGVHDLRRGQRHQGRHRPRTRCWSAQSSRRHVRRRGAQRLVVPQPRDQREEVPVRRPGRPGHDRLRLVRATSMSWTCPISRTRTRWRSSTAPAPGRTTSGWTRPTQILYAAYYNGGVVAIDVSGTLSGDISSRMIDTLSFGAGNTYTWGVQLYNGSLYAIDMLSGCGSSTRAWERLELRGRRQQRAGALQLGPLGRNGYAYTGTWGTSQRTGLGGSLLKVWQLSASGAPGARGLDRRRRASATVSDVEVSADGKLLDVQHRERPELGVLVLLASPIPAHPTLLGKYLSIERRPHGDVRDDRRAGCTRSAAEESERRGADHSGCDERLDRPMTSDAVATSACTSARCPLRAASSAAPARRSPCSPRSSARSPAASRPLPRRRPPGRGARRSRATSAVTSCPTTRCDGIVSRVAFPDLNTASTLLKVSLPSGTNGSAASARRAARRRPRASRSARRESAPPVSVIRPALRPPSVEAVLEREPHVARPVQVARRCRTRPPAGRTRRGARPRCRPP